MPSKRQVAKARQQRVEIVRSFSRKLNLGNYESADFFCSQKVTCDASKATEISETVYLWCKREVAKSLAEFLTDLRGRKVG